MYYQVVFSITFNHKKNGFRRNLNKQQPLTLEETTDSIGRNSLIDLLWFWKVEIGHNLNEFLSRLRQTRIECLLFTNGTLSEALVVMSRIDRAIIREISK